MIQKKEGKDMQYISSVGLICLLVAGAANAAYLPVVDVSRGGISARAAFGEDVKPIAQNNTVTVAPLQKKVVTRAAKKSSVNDMSIGGDVLRPNRPRSDLWAKSNEMPLRMPRIDEIAVINSDAMLPEESLDGYMSVKIAEAQEQQYVSKDEALSELKQLRAEISRLAAAQRETSEKIARARPMTVRTPISGNTDVKSATKSNTENMVNVRREIVSDNSEKNIIARNANNTVAEPKIASVKEMSKMSPNELKKAFKKTYLSENKHLSTYPVNDKFDTVSDMSTDIVGFDATADLSEMDGGVRPMEIKISFLNNDAGLSRENYNLLSETATIVVNNPKRAIQIAIPESVTHDSDARKLAARRLAIIEQVLRDTGIAERRIVPVLSQRNDDVFVLRVISSDVFESLTEQKRNMFGDSVSKKTYKSMSW